MNWQHSIECDGMIERYEYQAESAFLPNISIHRDGNRWKVFVDCNWVTQFPTTTPIPELLRRATAFVFDSIEAEIRNQMRHFDNPTINGGE